MLEFLMLLEQKIPAGFSVTVKRKTLGFEVEFRYGKIFSRAIVTNGQLNSNPELKPDTVKMFSEIILEDQVKKIRNHPQYRKQKAA